MMSLQLRSFNEESDCPVACVTLPTSRFIYFMRVWFIAGAKLTMKQTCFLLLELKRLCRFPDKGFDMLVRSLADTLLPEDNIMPSSLYLVERVMQSHLSDSCSYHACPEDHHIWPDIARADWEKHRDDCCPLENC